MLSPLLIAFQLLTRIPIPVSVEYSPRNAGRSLLFYPLVGLVIGGGLLLLQQLLAQYPVYLQAALLLLFWVGITGGLHLDGLADSADAWVGGMGDRSRMLEIMKDPASGPMGVTAIVLVLLLKWSLLMAVIEQEQIYLVVWAPLLARTLLITLFQTTPYLRAGGMGDALSQNVPRLGALITPPLLLVFSGVIALSWGVLLLYLITALLFRWWVIQQIGGITGDVVGAMVEQMELLLLLLVVFVQ